MRSPGASTRTRPELIPATCHSYVAFVTGRSVGVVVLADAPIDVDLLGMRILNRLLAPGA